MQHHDTHIMDDRDLYRGDAGVVGLVAARSEGAHAALVQPGAGRRLGGSVP